MRHDLTPDGRVRMLTSLGNPALWWTVNLALVVALAVAVWAAARALRREGVRNALRGAFDFGGRAPRLCLLLACWAAPMAPWLISRRDSYVYHYLLAYVFGVTMVAAFFDMVSKRRRTLALLGLLVIAQVALYYAPLWGQLPVSRAGVTKRLFMKTWR
jgi:dolichyl-phosphate-mannose--protein O-mannosyl transferase